MLMSLMSRVCSFSLEGRHITLSHRDVLGLLSEVSNEMGHRALGPPVYPMCGHVPLDASQCLFLPLHNNV